MGDCKPSRDARPSPSNSALRKMGRNAWGHEAQRAAKAIDAMHRIRQRILVPLAHGIARYKTLHYALTPVES